MGKHKQKSEKRKKAKSSSSSSSSEDEWVEKKTTTKEPEDEQQASNIHKREEWMSMPTAFQSESSGDRRKEREESRRQEKLSQQYDPKSNPRELNPYWKSGGDGVPSTSKFQKPRDDEDRKGKYERKSGERKSGWKKEKNVDKNVYTNIVRSDEIIRKQEDAGSHGEAAFSDNELNALAAKLVKAEIMGNTKLVEELKAKLDAARKSRESGATNMKEDVLLTTTDAKGNTRPVKHPSETSDRPRKKQKVETHTSGERIRYFADDDNYSLKDMFEKEKFSTAQDKNEEFVNMCGKVGKNDDLDDVFTDKIRKADSSGKSERRERDRAIQEHQQKSLVLDVCQFCIQSERMRKHLMISMGTSFYLGLPHHEPLTEDHCLLIPIRHATCSTQLEENEWDELMEYRRALTKMFGESGRDVIFFETAMHLKGFPHMKLECVPVDKEQGDEAPIYFKKAIDDSEMEWASNKKLVSLKGRDVRRAVPKGLPYFWVSFGMEEGYAHVIENERMFPANFAQEIIGGMLDLHHSKWRKPKREEFEEQSQRVSEFNKLWIKYDFTQPQ